MFLRKHRATLALLAFAAVYLLGALQLGVKARPIPESGFVPSLLGVLLLALCGWELLRPYFRPAKGEAEGEAPVAEGKLPSCAVILLGSVLSFEWLGFPATAAWVTFLSSRLMGLSGWAGPGLLSLGAALAADLIFALGLGVPLPGSLALLLFGVN